MKGFKFFIRAESLASRNTWTSKYGYTPLRGREKRTILNEAPVKIFPKLYAHDKQRSEWMADVFVRLKKIYNVVEAWPPPNETQESRAKRAASLQEDVKDFVRVLNKRSNGVPESSPNFVKGGFTSHQTSTSYLHILYNHAHQLVRHHGGIKCWNMQGVEYINNQDGKTLRAQVSGKKQTVLAELLLHNLRTVFNPYTDKTQAGERPYVCPTCDTRFRSLPYLRNHLRKVHSWEEGKLDSNCLLSFSVHACINMILSTETSLTLTLTH